MTEEQAIKGLKENLCSLCAYGSQNMDSCNIRECDNRDYIKALEQKPSDDCVSRKQAKMDVIPNSLYTSDQVIALLDNLSSVTPTHCIALVRFSKDDLREICNERIDIECTHGTCKDCAKSKTLNEFEGNNLVCTRLGRMAVNPDFYCADYEKRGNENGRN